MKILVTAQAFAVSGAHERARLESADCEIRFAHTWGPLDREALVEQALDCDAVIAATDPYDAETFASLPNLKLVARCGVGIDSVDLSSATAAGVLITNVPSAMTEAVADYCLGLILALARHIHLGNDCMRQGGWAEMPGIELRGKTLGLIGLGQIGRAVADRARSFGMQLIACDPQLDRTFWAEQYAWVESVSLDSLLARSHFVSLHAPNIPETRNLIDAASIAKMRPDAYLINTSRGALIDEAALIEALHSGRIAGAAIDVYTREPVPSDHALRSTPRLLLTPHNAFNSREAAVRMSQGCAEPILDLLLGHIPQHLCNPAVLNAPALRWPIPLQAKAT
jgi:phosphoglycerate dehydrogenase-like enzyme